MEPDPRAIPSTSKTGTQGDQLPLIGSGGTSKSSPQGDQLLIGSGLSHATGGVKSSLHGTIYQVKLLMFAIIRALMNNYNFKLGTEVEAAGSLDDMIFEYENNEEKGVVFSQAKHLHGKTINEIDLMNKDGPFSLPKYYSSYCKILEARDFKTALKDAKVTLVINTNIGIDKSIEDNFQEIATGEFAHDGFLHPGSTAQYAKFYRLVQNSLYDKIVALLEVNEPPLKLAEIIAKSVVNNKNKSIKIDDQFKRHRDWLLGTVFDYGTDEIRKQNYYYVSFKGSFLKNENCEFRTSFMQTFLNERNKLQGQKVGGETIETVITELSGVKFKVTKEFIKNAAKDQNKAKEFLDVLIFAVNQPTEDRLGEIVEREVGEYTSLPDMKSVACKFQTYILDWVKQKQGRYLLKEDVEQQLAVWAQTYLSYNRISSVQSFGYTFEDNNVTENITNFLKEDCERIICLYYSEQLLSEIKLCQALKYKETTKDEFIYSEINILSEQMNTKKCPIKAFNNVNCNSVFVVIKKQSAVKNREEMLLRRLFEIVKKDIQDSNTFGGKKSKGKKRILMLIPLNHKIINERNDFFTNLDSDGITRTILEDAKVNYGNLSADSKKLLFEKVLYKLFGNEGYGTVTNIFTDYSFPGILEGLRKHTAIHGKKFDDYVNEYKDELSKIIRDDVLSGLISGNSQAFKILNEKYTNMTDRVSQEIANDTLTTVINECTRADASDEEKCMSLVMNGLSVVSPLLKHFLEKRK